MVGNDVVDLGDPAVAGALLRARLVERVCHDEERALLGSSTALEPTKLFWSFFAAKEAAFKLVSKLGPPPPFAYRRFVVAPDLQSVRYEGFKMWTNIAIEADFIHAVASTEADRAQWAVERVEPSDDPSAAVRRLLYRTLAPSLACEADELEVVRNPSPGSFDGFGPPHLVCRERPSGVDVSLSHDGRFVAFAAFQRFPLQNCWPSGVAPCRNQLRN